jgi:hypothetical protein
MSKKSDLTIQPEQYAMGYTAYENGARTTDVAKKLNPYQGFGRVEEHERFISWNRGWNEAKLESEGEKPNV